MSNPMMNVDEVAEWLSVSPRMVRKLVFERRIPHYKVGSLVRFDEADLRAWRDEFKVEVLAS